MAEVRPAKPGSRARLGVRKLPKADIISSGVRGTEGSNPVRSSAESRELLGLPSSEKTGAQAESRWASSELVAAIENRLRRHIGAHDKCELPVRCRQPVGACDLIRWLGVRYRDRERAVSSERNCRILTSLS